MGGEDNLETFDAAIQLAASFKIGCVEVMDGVAFGFHQKTEVYTLERVRKNVLKGNSDPENPTAVMGNCGHDQVRLLSLFSLSLFVSFLSFLSTASITTSPFPSNQKSANKEIGEGNADLISIGRPYISNPDLPERFRDGIELAPIAEYGDWWTAEGASGYTSFPRAT